MRKKTDIVKDGERTQFSSENQPQKRGRKPGSLNRATILREWLETEATLDNPINGKPLKASVYDHLALALIKRGLSGDVPAIREIYDTLYGKIIEKQEISAELSGETHIYPVSFEEWQREGARRVAEAEATLRMFPDDVSDEN